MLDLNASSCADRHSLESARCQVFHALADNLRLTMHESDWREVPALGGTVSPGADRGVRRQGMCGEQRVVDRNYREHEAVLRNMARIQGRSPSLFL